MDKHIPTRHLGRLIIMAAVFSCLVQPSISQSQTRVSKAGPSMERRQTGLLPKHSLTIGVMSFFDGFTAITYEHRLSDRLCVSAGAGITYNSYFMQVRDQRLRDEAFDRGPVQKGPNTLDVEEEFSNRFYHEAKPGIYVSLAPKYYFNRKALDGLYVAPMLEFRDYRFKTYKASEAVFYAPYLSALSEKGVRRVREEVAETFRCYDLSAVAGGHHQMRNHLVISYYLGIGVRHSVINRQDFGLERVREGFYRYTNGMTRIGETRVMANFGFGIGGFW